MIAPSTPGAARERPLVPNHDLLRVIGKGAYGVIWMARSLTGALRAIKVVDRRNFASVKSFQREFEGMAKFEPISRNDGGFVDILHVGQNENGDFFYYVMELADDCTGGPVEPEVYSPKTLRSELARRCRLVMDECLAIGLSLTRARGSLHRHGLVHRDIKPANIIFVGGVPKIADIGLVATRGQDSYVGTEGYVPPEGPGTVQADLFSLGKVLYEMAMGKDRLDFPALHTDLSDLAPPERTRLMRLNDVLLRACAPSPAERYATAEELHADLETLACGQKLPNRRGWLAPVGVTLFLAAAAAAGIVQWKIRHRPSAVSVVAPEAMILMDGHWRHSPALFHDVSSGRHRVRVMRPGYNPKEFEIELHGQATFTAPPVQLERSHGVLQLASQPEGARFWLGQGWAAVREGVTPILLDGLPTGDYEVIFKDRTRERRQTVEVRRDEITECQAEFASGQVRVQSDPPGAQITIDGEPAGPTPLSMVLPEGPHHVVAEYPHWPAQRREVSVSSGQPAETAFAFARGLAKITSAPSGASVVEKGKTIGTTPLLLEDLEPGHVEYELRLQGYKAQRVTGDITPGMQTFLGHRFVQRTGPESGAPWENSLGMRFAAVGPILVAVWPVRVRDFEPFLAATARPRYPVDFAQDLLHPAVRVNWDDATAFCEWLTQKERTAGLLENGQRYRLPSDQEWSQCAGLPPEQGATPEERDGKLRDYLWGRDWPPPANTGNFADPPAKRSGGGGLPGYHDGFRQTSPVGSFPPNALGLYDMAGNIWQWVQDPYRGGGRPKDWGVLRGGSWGTFAPGELRASYRNVMDRGERDVIFGFRVVLVPDTGER